MAHSDLLAIHMTQEQCDYLFELLNSVSPQNSDTFHAAYKKARTDGNVSAPFAKIHWAATSALMNPKTVAPSA